MPVFPALPPSFRPPARPARAARAARAAAAARRQSRRRFRNAGASTRLGVGNQRPPRDGSPSVRGAGGDPGKRGGRFSFSAGAERSCCAGASRERPHSVRPHQAKRITHASHSRKNSRVGQAAGVGRSASFCGDAWSAFVCLSCRERAPTRRRFFTAPSSRRVQRRPRRGKRISTAGACRCCPPPVFFAGLLETIPFPSDFVFPG